MSVQSVPLRGGALFIDDVPAFLEILYRGSWYVLVSSKKILRKTMYEAIFLEFKRLLHQAKSEVRNDTHFIGC